jgi:prepilin-type N-terminal cleavage/methylation domain-containing protein
MKRAPALRSQRGMNLVELAISLAVMAIVAAGMLVPLVTQIEQRNVLTTETTIADLIEALLGFAAINGRLPCPATAAGGTGVEVFAAGGSAATGECAAFWGFVPGQTLGITPVDRNGYVIDAWNNRIRYAVLSTSLGTGPTTRPYTRTNGLRTATLAAIQTAVAASPPVLLQVCGSGVGVTAGVSCNAAPTLTASAVVVLWSPGPNASTTGGTGTDEAQNATSNDALFVSRTRSDDATNPFDDVVSWLGINTLVNRMVAAGQLP